ncbi:hypothetical protein N9V96_02315 [Polaribacter sp.]|nr:hypothetical protein [Polaribacter sp.]
MNRLITLKYLMLFAATVLFFSCGETNWYENYKEKEKSPFGTYILHEEAKHIFDNQEIIDIEENIYDYLFKNYIARPSKFKTYFLAKNSATKLDVNGMESLLKFVEDGNTVFMALESVPFYLKDSLKFSTNNLDINLFKDRNLKERDGTLQLNDFNTENDFHFNRNIRRNYFLKYDSITSTTLGTIKVDGEAVPNFMKIKYGKGAFYFHLHPIVFTNYYLLKDKTTYAANVLSYIPENPILWDSHIKSSEFADRSKDGPSVFSFFLEHETLTWFLYLSLLALLLFILFNTRRKQRPIPVIPPLENTTLAFTQTIGNLYLKEGNHKDLVNKKITFFLEKVRTRYLLNTNNLNDIFVKNLASKSGNSLQQTRYLINTIKTLHKKDVCSEEELVVFHKMITNFLNKEK